MKKMSMLFCFLLLLLTGCGSVKAMIGHSFVPKTVTIEDVTYCNGFYGDLYPVFGQAGDIGSDTLQEEVIYDDGTCKFRRVEFEGHDWVHSYIGEYTGGVVYCAESQLEQMRDYYADSSNFEYYYGVGYYTCETAVNVPEIDPQKFDELLAFSNENSYEPFDHSSNEKILEKVRRIPESEFHEGVCFYKVSRDGYFTSVKSMYFVHDGKLLLVFYHDGGRKNNGIKEVVAVDVPDELGQYFIELMDRYHL